MKKSIKTLFFIIILNLSFLANKTQAYYPYQNYQDNYYQPNYQHLQNNYSHSYLNPEYYAGYTNSLYGHYIQSNQIGYRYNPYHQNYYGQQYIYNNQTYNQTYANYTNYQYNQNQSNTQYYVPEYKNGVVIRPVYVKHTDGQYCLAQFLCELSPPYQSKEKPVPYEKSPIYINTIKYPQTRFYEGECNPYLQGQQLISRYQPCSVKYPEAGYEYIDLNQIHVYNPTSNTYPPYYNL